MKELLLVNVRRQMEGHLALTRKGKWTSTWWDQWSNLVATELRILKVHFGALFDSSGCPI